MVNPDLQSRLSHALGMTLAFAGLAWAGQESATACTTVLIGKGLTADGSVIHAHNEDMGNDAAGRLWAVAPAQHAEGVTLGVPYVELPQAATTFGYWASGNASGAAGLGTSNQSLPYDSVLVGLNQRGVSMSCNWAHSREDNLEGVGIRRYAIRQLLLERATSARHGVEILGELIETYGQADWGGLIYNLADSSEAWVVETTSRNWVARRVRDDEIRVTANRFRIGADYDLSSETLVSHAVENGWLASAEERLDFSQVYGRRAVMNQPYDTRREQRVLAILEAKVGGIEPRDLFPILRDRYEGSDLYTPPQPTPVWRKDLAERPEISRTINTNLAQSTFVAHMRGDLPVSVGSVMWFGFGTPSYAGYVPLYAGGNSVPREYSAQPQQAELGLEASPSSAWSWFRQLQRAADPRYEKVYPAVRADWDVQLARSMEKTRKAERAARNLLESGQAEAAVRLLAVVTDEIGQSTLRQVRKLLDRVEVGTADNVSASEGQELGSSTAKSAKKM